MDKVISCRGIFWGGVLNTTTTNMPSPWSKAKIKNPHTGRYVKKSGSIGRAVAACERECRGGAATPWYKKSTSPKKKSSPKGGKKGSPKKSAKKKSPAAKKSAKKKKTVRERQIELIMEMLRVRGIYKGRRAEERVKKRLNLEGQSDKYVTDMYWDEIHAISASRDPSTFMDKNYKLWDPQYAPGGYYHRVDGWTR